MDDERLLEMGEKRKIARDRMVSGNVNGAAVERDHSRSKLADKLGQGEGKEEDA